MAQPARFEELKAFAAGGPGRHTWLGIALAIVLGLTIALPALAAQPVFPLHVADNRRHLDDASGAPFLITGDAAWSLIADLPREDVDAYLADRKARGFNTLLVNLIESRFSRNAPRNFYGEAPFQDGKAFVVPNEAYFEHADWVLKRAREEGFLVLLTPAYLGVGGGQEGWYQAMRAAGPQALRAYGEYLGRRYRDNPNILWVEGGDYDPPDKALVEAVAQGIAAADPGALQSLHPSSGTVVRSLWGNAAWLALDSLYTYGDVAEQAAELYAMQPPRPFFLIESRYEGEGANAADVRRIAYGALLSGAAGQVFGNNPIWHFAGPGVHPSSMPWKAALSSPGAESIRHLKNLFDHLPWWKLQPGLGDMAGPATGAGGKIVGARADDGSLVIAYLSSAGGISLKASAIEAMQARWYDPSSGRTLPAVAEPVSAGMVHFPVPSPANDSGLSDWVIFLTPAERS